MKNDLKITNWLSHPITWMSCGIALILFACSSLRHALFQSTAWDLGIFDQSVSPKTQ